MVKALQRCDGFICFISERISKVKPVQFGMGVLLGGLFDMRSVHVQIQKFLFFIFI